MLDKKEDPLERKESVVALFLMGNVPEKISEKLAMPAKNVRKDLRKMGIIAVEDHLKSEEQVVLEVRQEIELLKQELWSMYANSNNTAERLKIIAELRELLSKKTDTVKKTSLSYVPHYSNGEKSLWDDVKENFFAQKKAANDPVKIEIVKDAKKESIIPKVEIIEFPKEPSCRIFSQKAPERKMANGEESPTMGYVYSPGFKDECEKDRESLEIVDWSKHLEGLLKEAKKVLETEKKEKTIEDKIAEFENKGKPR